MPVEVEYKVVVNTGNSEQDVNKVSTATKKLNKDTGDLTKTYQDIYGDAQNLSGVLGGLQDRLYELAQAGKQNTNEFKILTAEAGRLKRAQVEVDLAIEKTSLTMGGKLAVGARAASSAMLLVQGSMTALNLENEEMEASLNRLVASLAIADGVNGLNESLRGTKIAMVANIAVTKVVTVVTKLWNAALKSNPLVLLLSIIIAASLAVYGLAKAFEANSKSAKRAARAAADLKKAIADQKKAVDDLAYAQKLQRESSKLSSDQAYEEAKAAGASTKELRKLELQTIDNAIAIARESIVKKVNTRDTLENTKAAKEARLEKARAALDDANNTSVRYDPTVIQRRKDLKEEISSLEGDIKTSTSAIDQWTLAIGTDNSEYDKLLGERTTIINKHGVAVIQQGTDFVRATADSAADLLESNRVSNLSLQEQEEDAVNKKYDLTIANMKKLKKDTTALEDAKANELSEISTRYSTQEQQQLIDDAAEKTRIAIDAKKAMDALIDDPAKKLEAEAETIRLEQEALRVKYEQEQILYRGNKEKLKEIESEYASESAALDNDAKTNKKKADKKASDDEIYVANATSDAKDAITEAGINSIEKGIGIIKSLAGENRSLQAQAIIAENAVGVAKQVINNKAANGAVDLKYAGVPGGQIPANLEKTANRINMVTGIATSVAAAAQGLSSLGESGSLDSGTSGDQEQQAPSFNLIEGTAESQLASQIGRGSDNPIKAYVVSSEVTTAQQLDRNLIDNSGF